MTLHPDILAVIEGRSPWTVITADCLTVLPTLPAGCVDATATDPPFGIGWTRGAWVDDPSAYPEMMRTLVAEFNRVSRSWCFVFQAMPNAPRFHEWFGVDWRIFAACKNFAQIRPTGVWHSWDPVVFWNSGPNSGPNSGHVNRDYHVGNVAGELGNPVGHPCPRPLDTMVHIVQIAAPRGGIILDPFTGSGTTGVACVQTGRRFIGIEIDEKYAAIARRRIADAAPLFVPPPPEPPPALWSNP